MSKASNRSPLSVVAIIRDHRAVVRLGGLEEALYDFATEVVDFVDENHHWGKDEASVLVLHEGDVLVVFAADLLDLKEDVVDALDALGLYADEGESEGLSEELREVGLAGGCGAADGERVVRTAPVLFSKGGEDGTTEATAGLLIADEPVDGE